MKGSGEGGADLSGVQWEDARVTLPIDVASSSSNLKLHPLVFINDCITTSFLVFWYGAATRELERKREEKLTALSTTGIFFTVSFSLIVRLGEPDWGRVVVEKIVYSEWWLFRAWQTTVCWKVFDILLFDSSNHVGQEKILIFLIGIQQPQELRVLFKSDGSHFCLSHCQRIHFLCVVSSLSLPGESTLNSLYLICKGSWQLFAIENMCLITILPLKTLFSPRLPNTHCRDKAELSPLLCRGLRLCFVMLAHTLRHKVYTVGDEEGEGAVYACGEYPKFIVHFISIFQNMPRLSFLRTAVHSTFLGCLHSSVIRNTPLFISACGNGD